MKKYFLLKLIPPRPDFALTMNETEKDLMQRHMMHWTTALQAGKIIAFGPVADPNGMYGLGIASIEDENEIDEFQKQDPAMHSNLGFKYERLMMPRLVTK